MHIPVLSKEILQYLDPKSNDNFIDATFGMGGHAELILEKTEPHGKVLGIEIDSELIRDPRIQEKKEKYRDRLILINNSFANLHEIVRHEGVTPIQGILFDLGMSSWHLEKSSRGFSFQRDEPLIMSYEKGEELYAASLVNSLPETELKELFITYGEERFAGRIARAICEGRRHEEISSSGMLSQIILDALPFRSRHSRIHPATRVFQALRIAVNTELEVISTALPQALDVLRPEGRLVVISFHSLEDRIVKQFFRNEKERGRVTILTKKPIGASPEEREQNPRSRSAKLRAAQKLL